MFKQMRFNLKFLGTILFALVFLVGGFFTNNTVKATGPTLNITGLTANDGSGAVSIGGATPFTLTADPAKAGYALQFTAGSSSDVDLVTGINLKLKSSTLSAEQIAGIKAYYAAKPDPYSQYLAGALNRDNAFAVITTDSLKNLILNDGAKLNALDSTANQGMLIPGNFPTASYTLEGTYDTQTFTYVLTIQNPDTTPPTLNVTGFTADATTNLTGSIENGYTLNTNNVASKDYLIQFKSDTTANETLKSEFFPLKLTAISGGATIASLQSYYATRLSDPSLSSFLTYLQSAVNTIYPDTQQPFAYINGSTIKLVDAAKHDLIHTDVDMTIPGDYPTGAYTVSGKIKDVAGNETPVTYTLIVAREGDGNNGPNYTTIFGGVKTALTSIGIDTNMDTCANTPTACSGLYFEKVGKGKITFNTALDLTDSATQTYLSTLGSKLDMATAGKISLDAVGSALAGKSASIKFYGTDALGIPDTATPEQIASYIIVKNGDTIIPKTDTANYPTISGFQYVGNTGACGVGESACHTFSFTVGHFTTFEIDIPDTTPPTLTITGFTANGNTMSGSVSGGFILNTDNNANTHYQVQFAPGSVAGEDLKTEIAGLYLTPTVEQTNKLIAYYSTKPAPYLDYLNGAAAGSQPFAYIKTGGTNIKILDGAQYTLNNHTETDMIVPGDYPAGIYTVTGKIHDILDNETIVTYNLVIPSKDQTINFGALTNKTYGDADFTISATATSGLPVTFNSTTEGVCTINGGTVHLVSAGACTIHATQIGNNNYNAAPAVDQSFTVNTKQLTILVPPMMISLIKVYDGNTTAGVTAGALSGVISGDTVNVTTAANYDSKDIGTAKVITVVYTINGKDAAKYIKPINYSTNLGDITIKPITVTADAKTKVYGDIDPTLTYTVSPSLVNGDTLNGSLTRAVGTDVGTYAIASSLNNANYVVTYTGANLTITQKPITITAVTNTKTFVDGDTTARSAIPTLTTGTLITGDTATYSESYDNSTVGTGKVLTPSVVIKQGNTDVTKNYNITPITNNTGIILATDQSVPTTEGNAALDNSKSEVVLTNPTQTVNVLVGNDTTTPTIDVNAFVDPATVNGKEVMTGTLPAINIDSPVADVSIPATTIVTGPSTWDGVIDAPTSGTPTGGTAPAGFSVGNKSITVGSSEGTLTFSNAVTLILPGVTGAVGYRPAGSNTWTQITNICAGTYENPTDPTSGSECAINNGTDTKIVTFHFTSFAGLDVVQNSSSGGGYYIKPTIKVSPTVGKVLGAEKFNFTKLMKHGSKGNEIIELQKLLTSLGYDLGTADGKFGAKTKEAVIKFQKTNKLVGDGVVGTKTRLLLNK